ncbi:MAG TPA: CHAD domain-containing protein [Terriglobales bacterium]|jgi:CHAD domain-containing protein|nr:CHAD domain-containing protein [Terriglobales bacterium]
MAIPALESTKIGLGYWMQQALNHVEWAASTFSPEAVHDLRTALRRCRSIADGVTAFDADSRWKKMKKAGKQVFQSLGELRDTHVLLDWIEKLAPECDSTSKTLQTFLQRKGEDLKARALVVLREFDRDRWNTWSAELPARIAQLPADSPLLGHLALERWFEARELHHRALRNRTNVALHDLRIGIKRFRYTIENFLPALHEFWGADLKEVQDALGDVHDLDVLWTTATALNAFSDASSREAWRRGIYSVRMERLDLYRNLMIGRSSLWKTWRAALPKAEQLHNLGLLRLERWAGSLDPDVRHSRHVVHLALQLFDGISAPSFIQHREKYRSLLKAAALMHDVGLAKCNKGHHKESARVIRNLRVPLGWSSDEIEQAALVVRYHRGALPCETHKRFSKLSQRKRETVKFLGGLLRLACACDAEHNAQIRNLEVNTTLPVLNIRAQGYGSEGPIAQRLASARCLLELAFERPVFIAPESGALKII